jgi:hypothetical protein
MRKMMMSEKREFCGSADGTILIWNYPIAMFIIGHYKAEMPVSTV